MLGKSSIVVRNIAIVISLIVIVEKLLILVFGMGIVENSLNVKLDLLVLVAQK